MKLAFTSDLHLKRRDETPGRFKAFEDIIHSLKKENISELIIAGDLFNKEDAGMADFELLCASNPSINFHIIPGNHDSLLNTGRLFADNIYVYAREEIKDFKGIQLMFIPYREEISMGESIEKASLQLKEGMPLIITGHGDWLGGIRSPDPSEPGIYMPLTEADIKRHRPEKVILGHIHRPGCEGNVYYPGSPYPLDINESGKRRFLVLDLKNLSISCREVNTDKIYFNRSIFVFPFKDEPGFLKKEARKIKKSWGLNLNEIKKTRIRLKVKGYSEDRKAVAELLREEFGEYNFYDRGPDISELEYARVNSEKMEITEKLIDYVEGRLDWDFDALSPLKEDIVREALTLVFK